MGDSLNMQLLVAAVNRSPLELAEAMNIGSDAIVINQCDTNSYEELEYRGHRIRFYSFAERGVGASRNNALLRADADIALFADEDIIYVDNYREEVIKAFLEHPEADMIMFNVQAMPGRETYHIDAECKVGKMNCGRYSAYSTAVRVDKVRSRNVWFSLLFGGGAKYSNGEDSLFIRECISKGMRCVAVPVLLGHERTRESTWFKGYNRKFFYDRGVLFVHLYGKAAVIWALRFVLSKRSVMCQEIPWRQAFAIMREGIAEARKS